MLDPWIIEEIRKREREQERRRESEQPQIPVPEPSPEETPVKSPKDDPGEPKRGVIIIEAGGDP